MIISNFNLLFILVEGLYEDITSVFELKQQTNLVYNNSIIKCQAFHEAFGLTTEVQNMSASLRIIVVCTYLILVFLFVKINLLTLF